MLLEVRTVVFLVGMEHPQDRATDNILFLDLGAAYRITLYED